MTDSLLGDERSSADLSLPGLSRTTLPTLAILKSTPLLNEARVKVLLVDDRHDKRLALTAILEDMDIELVTAQSGRDALRMVLIHEFAVILLDVSMPQMDGIETASLIRQRKRTEHLPIIFITAFRDTDEQALRGYELGAYDYIFSPVIPKVLRAKVSVFIDLFKKSREISRQSELLRIESEHRVASLENRLDGLLNRLHVGVYRLTRQGVLISANPSFYLLFGIDLVTAPQPLNFPLLYLNDDDRTAIAGLLEVDGEVVEYPVRQCRPDGTVRWVSLSKVVIVDLDGGQHVDGLAEDITARKQAEEALIAKAQELARSNSELEEFAYVASHDLQEPLRTVSSYASLIAGRYADRLDDKGRNYFEHIVGGATHMQNLIRDILAFSKIGKGLTQITVNCNEVMDRVLFHMEQSIATSGAAITREILPTIIGDPVLLGQVFQNLISNALKFRHKDRHLTVHIGVERRGSFWSFSIADNGIGISAQHFEKIFSIFQRLHTREEYAGTGIGLAICRKAIQQLGGTITVESELDSGSVFRFRLPCTDAQVP